MNLSSLLNNQLFKLVFLLSLVTFYVVLFADGTTKMVSYGMPSERSLSIQIQKGSHIQQVTIRYKFCAQGKDSLEASENFKTIATNQFTKVLNEILSAPPYTAPGEYYTWSIISSESIPNSVGDQPDGGGLAIHAMACSNILTKSGGNFIAYVYADAQGCLSLLAK